MLDISSRVDVVYYKENLAIRGTMQLEGTYSHQYTTHVCMYLSLIKFISSINLGLYIKNRGGDIESALLA